MEHRPRHGALDDSVEVHFDAQITHAREAAARSAIAAGRHGCVEKPTADNPAGAALEPAEPARDAGVKNGAAQDGQFPPRGMLTLRRLSDSGFLCRILSNRGEFGCWAFEGDRQPAQRPSRNCRAEDGGGIALGMFLHRHSVPQQRA